MKNRPSPEFDRLTAAAGIRKLHVGIVIENKRLAIAVRSDDRLIEKESVRPSENVDKAAKRLYTRLKKERILD